VVRVVFTRNLERHVSCPPTTVDGTTVHEVLSAVFAQNERLRSYVVDEHGALRKHMVIFVDGSQIVDRETLSDAVAADGEIYVMQALSGGS
jgi:molybdopterin synthase sulfur carrier subunit